MVVVVESQWKTDHLHSALHLENTICLKPEGLVSESQYRVDVHLDADRTHLFLGY